MALQAFLNIAVVTSTVPFTGITLPFVSYGGSSMLVSFTAMGILLNITRYTTESRVREGRLEKNKLRLLLTGGGTGGHVFPVLAVVQAARGLPSLEVEALHLGTQAEVERRILAAAGIPTRQLSVGGLRGMNPLRLSRNAVRMAAAVRHGACGSSMRRIRT